MSLTPVIYVDNQTVIGASNLNAIQDEVVRLGALEITSASGAPTTSTSGTVKQMYYDTTNANLYICTAAASGVYTWQQISGGTYLYIRYSATQPTSDTDMKTTPDAWMGVHTGTETTAPTHYTDYVWYKIKGEGSNLFVAEWRDAEGETSTTYDEVAEAYSAGEDIVLHYSDGTGDAYYWLTGVPDEEDAPYYFGGVRGASGEQTLVAISLSSTDVYGYARVAKTTSVTSSSTDNQYPTAKAVYDAVSVKESTSNKVTSLSSSSTDTQYPSAKAVYDVADGLADEEEADAASASERYEGVDLTVKFATEIANYSDEWAWMKARVTAHNYEGLRVHDYIPVTCTNGYVLKEEIVGFDTYKGSGSPEVGNHIDFMSKDAWPGSVKWNLVNNTNGFAFIFSGDGSTTDFTCNTSATNHTGHTFTNYPHYINRVTVGGSTASGWTYDNTTGVVHLASAPASGVEIQCQAAVALFSSNVYAYLNGLKTVVQNTTTQDGDLADVDYTSTGVLPKLPSTLKNVITGKKLAWPQYYRKGTILSAPNEIAAMDSAPLWLPDEVEVYGASFYATNIESIRRITRWYPGFHNANRTKGLGNGGSRIGWGLGVPNSGTNICYVHGTGLGAYISASTSINFPICFRITA